MPSGSLSGIRRARPMLHTMMELKKMLPAINISPEATRMFKGWLVILVMMITFGELYLRSSTPAAVALNFAEHNVAVQKAVGGVENARLNWIGHIHYEGIDGWASFALQVTGARTNGTMDVILKVQSGHWVVSSGRLITDAGRTLTITEPGQIGELRADN